MAWLQRWLASEWQEWKRPSYVPIAETPGGKIVASILRIGRKRQNQLVWNGPTTIDSPTDGAGSAAYN